MTYDTERYSDFGRNIHVFDFRRTIVVEAGNADDAEDEAYSHLAELMATGLQAMESGDVSRYPELTYLGKKAYDNRLHMDAYIKE